MSEFFTKITEDHHHHKKTLDSVHISLETFREAKIEDNGFAVHIILRPRTEEIKIEARVT